jgi:energy-coupling factor transporter ATP-binding protein EcfA2
MAHAILLIGPVGSGKTTTLHELEAILAARDLPNAIVDLDWLAWATPPACSGVSHHELLVRNLADVWANYRAVGIHHIAVARALHDAAEVQCVRNALRGCETCVVELVGDTGVLRERIRRRDTGVELAEHLAMLDAFDVIERDLRPDAVVEFDDQTPEQIARDVLGVAGW